MVGRGVESRFSRREFPILGCESIAIDVFGNFVPINQLANAGEPIRLRDSETCGFSIHAFREANAASVTVTKPSAEHRNSSDPIEDLPTARRCGGQPKSGPSSPRTNAILRSPEHRPVPALYGLGRAVNSRLNLMLRRSPVRFRVRPQDPDGFFSFLHASRVLV